MSEAHTHAAPGAAHDDGPHEGPIRTPKQLVLAIVASFVVPIAIIILLINFVNFGARPAAGTAALDEEAVALRLQRVGSVVWRDASAPVALRSGEEVYKGAVRGLPRHRRGRAHPRPATRRPGRRASRPGSRRC
jgi:hypothetical protein